MNKAEVIEMAKKMAESDGDRPITINAAGRKYDIHPAIISQWRKYGWVRELGRGPRRAIYVSEKDVAKLASLCHTRGKKPGKRLLPKAAYPKAS